MRRSIEKETFPPHGPSPLLESFYSPHSRMLSPPLKKLFQITLKKAPSSLSDALRLAQESFLRPKNKERWELHDRFLDFFRRPRLLPLFSQLGIFDPLCPSAKKFDSVLILGSDVHDYLHRLSFFLDLSIETDRIYLLAGDRSLYETEIEELRWRNLSLPRLTEDHMMEALFPKELSYTLISSPKKPGETRPTTFDTIEKWLKEAPTQGSHLLISSQPFALYQLMIAINATKELLQRPSFAVAAPGYLPRMAPIAVGLDTVARILYELNHYYS